MTARETRVTIAFVTDRDIIYSENKSYSNYTDGVISLMHGGVNVDGEIRYRRGVDADEKTRYRWP